MKKPTLVNLVTGLLFALPHAFAAEPPKYIEGVEHRTARCSAPHPVINCEVSAVTHAGGKLVLANDKPVPVQGGAAIFTLDLSEGQVSGQPAYLSGDVIKRADKFEALTTTLDGKYIIASTAFNKVGTEQDPRADALNTLVYWPVEHPAAVSVLSPSSRGGIDSSLGIREEIHKAIGSPYFQVEGITIAPEEPGAASDRIGQLVLGIRKHGQSSAESQFSFLLVSAPITLKDGQMELAGTFKSIQFPNLSMPKPGLGLSGIEYDRFNNDRLYAVTSFEDDSFDDAGKKTTRIGGFLWVVPFTAGKPGTAQLVNRKDGSALQFSNKPEGVDVLDANHILVVHDDDRVQVQTSATGIKRGDSEFAYSLITFPPTSP